MFRAGAVWLCPQIELIVRGKVGSGEGVPTGRYIGRRAGAALLHLLHTSQVPWVKLGAEHNITKASLHGSWLSLVSFRGFREVPVSGLT